MSVIPTNPSHLRHVLEVDHHARSVGEGATHEAASTAIGNEGDMRLPGPLHQRLYLSRGARAHDTRWRDAEPLAPAIASRRPQPIQAVACQLGGIDDNLRRAEQIG